MFPFIINGQNKLNKKFNLKSRSIVELKLPFASSVNISNSDSNFIEYNYTTRGEYKNSTFISSNINKDRVYIEEKLISNSIKFNDKLSIHKNYSTSLNILVPEHIILELYVREAITEIKGDVSKIDVYQNSGEMYLENWNSPGILKTISTNIFFSNPKIKILSNSKKQFNCNNSESNNILDITTVSGIIKCITF